ncbi:PREDICTED: extended synaptotagmin-2-A-like [Acropora digitifera]|uniref:extended synaptotagmin-2-A-like n=1 Tax=Acropora digitifera TaxID=70779 RepID=UPI00077A5165|nr:PREDICTED: extended synaptotagmin-2-A-like [Acropora digitifera]
MASAANEKQGSDDPSEKQTTNETETTVVAENEAKKPAKKTELAILKFVLKYLKLVGGALLIWFMGWLGLSYVWIICGLFIYVLWRLNADERKTRRDAFREAAEKEEEVVEARMEDLPSWVFFPDVERAEWLNKMLVQLWPYINDMVIKILKETVEPEIQKNVPSFLSSIHFGEISLGQVNIHDDDSTRHFAFLIATRTEEAILTYMPVARNSRDPFPGTFCDEVIALYNCVQVRGSMRVILRPLIPAAPLVGGVSVFFLNRPDIDFDLTNLANILDIPGLSDILRGVIDDVVASIVVLPNKITVPLTNIDPYELKYPLPDGVLRIEVLEAKDLIKKDIGVFKKGSSDPYVVLRVGAKTFRTKTKDSTLNPVWNEVFEAFVDNSHGQKIKISLFDEDKASDDESLGTVEADIGTIAQQGNVDLWLPLENVESGQLNLRCTWFSLTSNPEDLSPPDKVVEGDETSASAALFVKLDSAKNLPVTNAARGTTSAFCKLTVGNVTFKSKTIQDSVSPVWEEPFRFLIHDPKYQELDIEIFDSQKEKSIGKLDFSLAQLIKSDDMTMEQHFPLKGSGHNSTLTCKLTLKVNMYRLLFFLISCMPLSLASDKGHLKRCIFFCFCLAPSDASTVRRRKAAPKVQRTVSGDVRLTTRYNKQGSKLEVMVHQARNLLACDSDGLSDPYVRAYLLPDKSRSGRRRTDVKKNTLEPVFEETFDWFVPEDKLKERTLDITVKNNVSFFSKSKTSMGQVLLDLGKMDLSKAVTEW